MHFVVIYVLLSFSLSAALISKDELEDLKSRYRHNRCFFQEDPEGAKTLEVRFIRDDKGVCGLEWDLHKTEPADQSIWNIVDEGILNEIYRNSYAMTDWWRTNKPIDMWGLTSGLKKMRSLAYAGHISVRDAYGLHPITMEHMESILNPPPAHPWQLALSLNALNDRIPGTLSITAVGAECCLVRLPSKREESAPLSESCVQQQSVLEKLEELQTFCADMFAKTHGHLATLLQRCDRMEKRLTALEANKYNAS